MTDLPNEGGTYLRDPVTGALTRQPDEAPAEPEAPTASTSEPKPKGGK